MAEDDLGCHDLCMGGHGQSVTSPWPDREARFRDCYHAYFDLLLAYAIRRTDQPADAADVVAETFLVAWRRLGDLPPEDEARLWFYGVARRVLANHHRSGRRRERLGERLRERLAREAAPDPADEVVGNSLVLTALARLGDLDREVLTLSVWEQLAPREIATILGISDQAVRTRLSRARGRLRTLLRHDATTLGHVSGVRPVLRPEESP